LVLLFARVLKYFGISFAVTIKSDVFLTLCGVTPLKVMLHREVTFSFAGRWVCCSRPQTSHYLLASFSPVSSSTNFLQTYLFIG